MTTLLVSTDWLEEHLDDPNVRIVDIRGKSLVPQARSTELLDHYQDYVGSHIPNAVFVNWVEDITDDANHKRVAPSEKYANMMGKLGISNDHLVVAYDDASNALAARMWWTLHYYGHTNVAVLDGGWQKWVTEDRITTSEMPQVQPAEFTATPNDALRREGADILHMLNGSAQIIDMRLTSEFSGAMSLAQYSGHIPGAANLPVNTLINENNELLPPDELRDRLKVVGVDESTPETIFYSNVGVLSCLGILAMRVAGLDNPASNYDASWQEWGNDVSKPKAK